MKLDARLNKLESQTMRIVRCAHCRTHLACSGQEYKSEVPQENDYVWFTCRWCGNRYRENFCGFTPRLKEALLLWYQKYDGETYRDERAYAAMCWWNYYAKREALLKERARAAKYPGGDPSYAGNPRRKLKKLTKFERERKELKEQADALIQKAREREEKLYGPSSFPLMERLEQLGKGAIGYMFDGDDRRSDEEEAALKLLNIARCREACEMVLWDEVEPETQAQIESLTAEVAALREKRLREKLEKEEEKARKQAERERERLERLAPTEKPMIPQPRPHNSSYYYMDDNGKMGLREPDDE